MHCGLARTQSEVRIGAKQQAFSLVKDNTIWSPSLLLLGCAPTLITILLQSGNHFLETLILSIPKLTIVDASCELFTSSTQRSIARNVVMDNVIAVPTIVASRPAPIVGIPTAANAALTHRCTLRHFVPLIVERSVTF